MALRFIRQPSETPNVGNADDARMIRYAYGGSDGYVKGKGTELGFSKIGTIFRINSGVVVLQGYEVEIDANGWEMTVDNIPTKRYFSVFLEVNLATQTAVINATYNTSAYPIVTAGDDLTATATGTARLLLYTFTATSGVIADESKKIAAIEYLRDLKDDLSSGVFAVHAALNAPNLAQTENNTKIANTAFVRQAISDALNIIEADIVVSAVVIGKLRRQGNFVICSGNGYGSGNGIFTTIPEGFRPKTTVELGVSGTFQAFSSFPNNPVSGGTYGQVDPSGNLMININNVSTDYLYALYEYAAFYGGWEITE